MDVLLLNAGRDALAAAVAGATTVQITSVQIGDAANVTLDPEATGVVGNLVYTGNASVIYYNLITPDEIRFIVRLDQSIGDFQIGNLMMFLSDGTPFMSGTIATPFQKAIQNLPAQVGNNISFNMTLGFAAAASGINLTILNPLYATLPSVDTNLTLPAPAFAAYDAYIVQNDVRFGIPQVVIRRVSDNTWWGMPFIQNYTASDYGSPAPIPYLYMYLVQQGFI